MTTLYDPDCVFTLGDVIYTATPECWDEEPATLINAGTLMYIRGTRVEIIAPHIALCGGFEWYFSHWQIIGCHQSTSGFMQGNEGFECYFGLTLPLHICEESPCNLSVAAVYKPAGPTCPWNAAHCDCFEFFIDDLDCPP